MNTSDFFFVFLFSILMYGLGYFLLPKLVAYTDKLYTFKKRKKVYKKRDTRFFTFLPKRTKVSIFNKLLIVGSVSALLFFVLVSINYEAPNPYLLETAQLSLESMEEMDPFKNTNSFAFFAIVISGLINCSVIMFIIYRFFEKITLITLYKVVQFTFNKTKALISRLFNKNKPQANNQ